MLGYLEGKILDFQGESLLVGVGLSDSHAGVVGYEVTTPQNRNRELLAIGNRVKLFVYTHVREDALDLYGFLSAEEKEMFLTLLSARGIGPKVALGILSHFESHDLIRVILHGEKDLLSAVPGIGKKTAERIVLELQDKLEKKIKAGVLSFYGKGAVSASSKNRKDFTKEQGTSIFDAKAALLHLGYRESDVAIALDKLTQDIDLKNTTTEDVIRFALKELS